MNDIYPNIKTKIETIDLINCLTLESWVRFKQSGKWYEILNKEVFNIDSKDVIANTCKAFEDFNKKCIECKHLLGIDKEQLKAEFKAKKPYLRVSKFQMSEKTRTYVRAIKNNHVILHIND